jgi:PAS domain S-box-containing protein
MTQIWRWTDAGLERWTNRAWNVRFADDGEGGTWWADGDALLHIGADGALDRAEAAGLSSDNRALFIDAEGSLWIGSGNRGLFHLEPRRMALWAAPSAGDVPGVLPVAEARDGVIWTGGSCGPLVRWGPDGPRELPLPRPASPVNLTPCLVELLPTPDGGLWALSQEEIWWVDAGAPVPTIRLALALPASDARIRTAALSPDGALVVSRGGLEPEVAAPDGQGGVRLRPIGRPELPRPRAGLTFTWGPDGDLWAAAEGELVRLPAEGGPAQRWGFEDGLPRGLPRALRVVGPDEVWIGTYGGGLALLRDGKLRRLSTRQGLVENIVSQVIIDQTGGMWLNGNRGISWVPAARVNAFRTGETDELSAILYAEGEGNGGSMSAGGLSRSGQVLLPTVDGLRVLRPEAPAPSASAAPVVFESVLANDQPVPIVDGRAALPAGADAVQVQFRSLSFRSSDRLRFRHRLGGFDQRWVEVGTSRTARYTNLPPGRYALQLQVQGTAGVWVDTAARLELEVQPAWHQRRTFRAVLVLVLVGAGGLLWASRTRALRRRNAQLLAELDAQRLADAETRAREQRYRAVFEQAHNGFLLHRADGALLDLNHKAAELFGASTEALRAAAPLSFLEPEGHGAYRAMLRAAAAGSAAEVEVWASRPGAPGQGPRFLLRAEARPHAVGGDRACLVAVADRSASLAQEEERAQLQRTVEQAQRLDAVGRLAGGVAHDFNNELTAILLQVDQLRGAVAGASAQRGLEELEASAQRAAEITRGLLSFSRGQLLQPRALDLRAACAEMQPLLGRFADARGGSALVVEGGEEVWVVADPTQLSQIVLNLVINAFDALAGTGTVRLRAWSTRLGPGDQRLPPGQPPGDYGVLEVADDGPGMSPEVRARAFEPFFTTKAVGKGTGLGLAQVHGIAAQSGGFAHIETAPGAGCAVAVHLPRASAEQRAAAPSPAAAPTPSPSVRRGEQRRVLVCDDNAAVLRAARLALQREGFRVDAHEAPLEALRAVAQREGPAFDLLLTDVRMPDLDGPALAAAVQRLQPGLRVLYMSGYSEVRVEDAELGWLLSKPFTPRALLERVWARLDAPADG